MPQIQEQLVNMLHARQGLCSDCQVWCQMSTPAVWFIWGAAEHLLLVYSELLTTAGDNRVLLFLTELTSSTAEFTLSHASRTLRFERFLSTCLR